LKIAILYVANDSLKRRLKKLGLRRSTDEDQLDEAVSFIEHELKNAGKMLGYRMLHVKCRRKGFQIFAPTI